MRVLSCFYPLAKQGHNFAISSSAMRRKRIEERVSVMIKRSLFFINQKRGEVIADRKKFEKS